MGSIFCFMTVFFNFLNSNQAALFIGLGAREGVQPLDIYEYSRSVSLFFRRSVNNSNQAALFIGQGAREGVQPLDIYEYSRSVSRFFRRSVNRIVKRYLDCEP